MKADQLKEILTHHIKQDPRKVGPLMIRGGPGVGKSSIVQQVAVEVFGNPQHTPKERNRYFKDIRLPLYDPVEIKGYPAVKDDAMVFVPPKAFPNGGDDPRGIIVLDELPAAPPAVQVGAYQLTLDRRLGDYWLPDGWHVIACGNREGDRSVYHTMPSPLANRFQAHLELEPDLDSWKSYAIPRGIQMDVVSFLNYRPALLYKFEGKLLDRGFPTPRSWVKVSKILKFGYPHQWEMIAGAVGEGAATEFLGFVKVQKDLPDVDDVLSGKAKLPKESDRLYALCGALAQRYRDDRKIAKAILVVAQKMAQKEEYSILLLKDCLSMEVGPFLKEKEFDAWRKQFGKFLGTA